MLDHDMWFLMQIILCLIFATLDAFSIANGALSGTTITDNGISLLYYEWAWHKCLSSFHQDGKNHDVLKTARDCF